MVLRPVVARLEATSEGLAGESLARVADLEIEVAYLRAAAVDVELLKARIAALEARDR